MKKCNILYHSITMLFFTTLLSSCLKETTVPIELAFTIHHRDIGRQNLTCNYPIEKRELYSWNKRENWSPRIYDERRF
ncbi:hypothetical protein [Hoylesella nanceiensis]|uniref:hypothetical protein n=1 Tax=Hoylesella nanceiensis TaxID=425941 RepID=UPI001F0A03BB|nr:hypothetical protein [Hoylesella nanceiensis]